MRSGVIPALPSSAERAIEKQPACAAAISSSGLVPFPSSKRVLNEYCVFARTPLSVEMVPLPSLSPPFHSADALRFMVSLLSNLRDVRNVCLTAQAARFKRLDLFSPASSLNGTIHFRPNVRVAEQQAHHKAAVAHAVAFVAGCGAVPVIDF